MKKRFLAISVLLVLSALVLFFVACNGFTEDGGHKHSFNESVIAPTCTQQGYTVHTCVCGYSYNDSFIPATGHTEATDAAVPATCTATGLTEGKHCSVCREVIIAQQPTNKLPHEWGAYLSDSNATCTADGTKTATCLHCTAKDTVADVGSMRQHEWGEHHSNGNATCTADGTKTATCLHCTAIDTVVDVGSATGHTPDANGVCKTCGYVCGEGLTYSLNGDNASYTVTGIGTCEDTDLFIPLMYNGLPVNCIAEGAFRDCTNLTSVIISGNVTEIGECAFLGCSGLTSATIPDGVTRIGDYAFSGCNALAFNEYYNALYLGNATNPYVVLIKVKSQDITSCTVHENAKVIYSGAFEYCRNLVAVTIGNKVTDIGQSAFVYCTGLNSVIIPNSVTTMGDGVFYGCSGLASVSMGSGLTEIGRMAFYNCGNLASVTIPSGVTTMGDGVFYYCTALATVQWNAIDCTIITEPVYYAYEPIFSGTGITSITFADGVKTVPCKVLDGCSGITSITIPSSVTAIGDYALRGCTGITEITIPDSVTEIGTGVFDACSSLTNITLPFVGKKAVSAADDADQYPLGYLIGLSDADGTERVYQPLKNGFGMDCYIPSSLRQVTVTGGYLPFAAFCNCTMLTSVTLKEGVTGIADYAFSGCSGLTSVTIPGSVTSIGNRAFSGCSGLTSVTIPGGATSIGEYAFSGCRSLTSITIPGSVTSIGEYAFLNCSGLTSVTLFEGVTSIDSSVFYECSNITSIYYVGDLASWCAISGLNNITSSGRALYINGSKVEGDLIIPSGTTAIADYAFRGCSGITSVTIPGSVTAIGEYAFRGCSGLTSVTILSGVTSIGEYAFFGCTGLASVTIPGSVTSIGYNAFYNDNNSIKTIYYTGDLASWCAINGLNNITSSGRALYINGSKVEGDLIIPSGTTAIAAYAFRGCSDITSVTIPGSVTAIGEYAFQNCGKIKTIYYTGDVASWCAISGLGEIITIGRTLYINGNKVEGDLIIPSGATAIGDCAFYGCSDLASVTIPVSVTSMGVSVFYGCTGLSSINYAGTTEQWEAISKHASWEGFNVGNYTLHCLGDDITE